MIKAFSLSLGDENEDQLVWDRSSNGEFSIKLAINIIRGNDQVEKDPIWQLIWHSRGPQCLRFFLWLYAYDRLMTNLKQFKRGLSSSPCCKSCSEAEESFIHLMKTSSRTLLPHDWLFCNLKPQAQYGAHWPTLFTNTLWWIWKWHNIVCFENSDHIPSNPETFIKGRYREIIKTLDTSSSSELPLRSELHIKWLAPPVDWVKLNVDGASRGNPGLARGVGVLQGSLGN
ncbi:hypothetical protein Cgig2_021852 [Carnegiea gigantea]|uniref:Reverse transcriptase zinc-binding domain-containing protein n=1 Tax=Carnegiea gigantea TaxID=171969 RepID=A0A9Q1JKJ7_9CARY|nr:hypothetical protein Cgig2_021852 [Carnegiea gigantea]